MRRNAHQQREDSPRHQVDADAVMEILNGCSGSEVGIQEAEGIDEQCTEGHPEATV